MFDDRRRITSRVVVLVLWSLIVGLVLREPPSNVLSWDTFGYYLYLPAAFIHGDVALQDQSWVQEVFNTYHNSAMFYQAGELPDGRWVMKYPMGLAVLWAPFFAIGHLVAGISGHPQDGFSAPYQWSVLVASLLYLLAGLLLTRRLLGRFFNDRVTAIVIALVVLGTNYLHQALYGGGMPHVFLFTLYAAILWYTVRWYEEHRMRDAVLLAVMMGLAILSRPSEVVCVFIPLFYGLKDVGNWKEHVGALMKYRGQLMVVIAVLLLIGLPQLIYWKWLIGKFLYMSYNNPGEGFEFLHPYIWEVLFSFRKGWYIYTPLMAVATGGLFLLYRTLPAWRWSLITFFLFNLYIVGSWSCWWYADSFGQRSLVQSYAVMALPLGAVVQWLGERRLRAVAGVMFLAVLALFNLFQTYQSTHGLIHTSRMTWPAYKAVFGKIDRPKGLDRLFSIEGSFIGENVPEDLSGYVRRPFATLWSDGTTEVNEHRVDPGSYAGGSALALGPENTFSDAIPIPWARITDKDHVWIEVTGHILRPLHGPDPKVAVVRTFGHKGFAYAYQATEIPFTNAAAGEWQSFSMWYLSPAIRRPEDVFEAYFWWQGRAPGVVDELKVIIYEPRIGQ